jgi:hypothetical protein
MADKIRVTSLINSTPNVPFTLSSIPALRHHRHCGDWYLDVDGFAEAGPWGKLPACRGRAQRYAHRTEATEAVRMRVGSLQMMRGMDEFRTGSPKLAASATVRLRPRTNGNLFAGAVVCRELRLPRHGPAG